MNLVEVLRVVRERRLIILSCLVLGLLGAAVATRFIQPTYSTQVTMFVAGSTPAPVPASQPPAAAPASGTPTAQPTPVQTAQQNSVYQANELAQSRMTSYVQLVTSDRITAPVVQTLNLGVEPSELADQITVSNVPNTVVMTVAVTDQQPEKAAQIANSVAEQFVGLVQQLEAQSGSNQISVAILQPAAVPTQPISPKPLFNLVLGAALGLLLGLVGAFVRDALDMTFRSRERLAQTTGAPTLGVIPFISRLRRQPLITAGVSRSGMVESFRQLRTNLYYYAGAIQGAHRAPEVDGTVVNLVVTSSLSGEGTTSIVCNLAIAAADAGRTVLVVDANLRSPGVADLFQLEQGPGLAEVLTGDAELPQVVQTWQRGAMGVDILPSGKIVSRSSELLSSRAMLDLLTEVRGSYDLVLIDTPPLLPLTDAAAVAPHADGVLLVVRYGRTTSTQVETATDALKAVSGALVGTVISMVPRTSPRIRLERPKESRTGSHTSTVTLTGSHVAGAGDGLGVTEQQLQPTAVNPPTPQPESVRLPAP